MAESRSRGGEASRQITACGASGAPYAPFYDLEGLVHDSCGGEEGAHAGIEVCATQGVQDAGGVLLQLAVSHGWAVACQKCGSSATSTGGEGA